MKEELEFIKKELRGLKQEIKEIKDQLEKKNIPIQDKLKIRGFIYLSGNPRENLVLPQNCDAEVEEQFYQLMKKYSFRIFLRDVLKSSNFIRIDSLTRFCSKETAEKYLKILAKYHLLEETAPACYQLKNPLISDLGDTLEWFVAKVLEREFYASASWGVKLRNTGVGGDYDVIASVEGLLIYVEVKSSPPKHVEMSEISAFLDRAESLKPDFSIFLEDTELRMKDKIVKMFEEVLEKRYGRETQKNHPVRRFLEELFQIDHRIFIINSRPDLVSNLGFCLKNYFDSRYELLDKKYTKGNTRYLSI